MSNPESTVVESAIGPNVTIRITSPVEISDVGHDRVFYTMNHLMTALYSTLRYRGRSDQRTVHDVATFEHYVSVLGHPVRIVVTTGIHVPREVAAGYFTVIWSNLDKVLARSDAGSTIYRTALQLLQQFGLLAETLLPSL